MPTVTALAAQFVPWVKVTATELPRWTVKPSQLP